MAINISFVSDVRSFLKGTSDIHRAMDDVGDALDDVSREAQRKGDKIGDALTDAGREAERASEQMERALRQDFDKVADHAKDAGRKIESASEQMERTFRQDFDKVADHAKDAGRTIERETKDSMGRAGAATGEFKSEAIQNVAETASSFDGSMDDIASMVQGTLGGLATLPGVGLGVAALGALGGLVYEDWKKATEDTKQAVADMFADMLESGMNYRTQEQVATALQTLYEDEGKLNTVKDAAEDLGLTVEQVATAYVTAGAARDAVMARAAELLEEERQAIADLQEQGIGASRAEQEALGHSIKGHETKIANYESIIGLIEGQNEATETAAAQAESYRQAVALAQANVRGEYEATRAVQEGTTQGAIDDMRELSTSINGLPQAVVRPVLDRTDFDRDIRRLQDGTYEVRINGRLTGLRYE